MKDFLLSIFFMFLLQNICAQLPSDSQKARAVVLELGGSGGLGSINVEKHFKKYGNFSLNGRIGLSAAPIDKNNGTAIVFPLMLRGLWGKHNHFAEFGIGQGISITTKGHFFALTPVYVGYRYHKNPNRMFYSVGYSPLVSYLFDFQWQHWAGVGIGYTFNPKKK